MRKVGGYLIPWAGMSVEDRLKGFKNAGFEFLALSMGGVNHTNEKCVTPELADKYGMEVQNVHLNAVGTNHIWAEGPEGEEITERYCNDIKLAASYGIKIGITHVTWDSALVPPEVSQLGLERFKRIEECAVKNNFIVALENSITTEHLYYAIDNLQSGNIGYCYDTGHRYCYTPDADFIGKYGDKLVSMHIDDNDGYNDTHMLPFDGIAPWDDIINDLSKTKLYDEYVLLELNGRIHRKLPSLNAEQIRERISRTKIANDPYLTEVFDGEYYMYRNLSFEEYAARAYDCACRIAKRK